MMLMRAAPHAQMGQQGVPQQMIGMQPVMVALQGVPMGYGPQVHGAAAHAWVEKQHGQQPGQPPPPAPPRRTAAAAAGGVPYSAQPAASAAAARRNAAGASARGLPRCRRVALDAAVAAGVVAAVASRRSRRRVVV